MEHVLTSLGAAVGLVWLALLLVGLAYTFARREWRRSPTPIDPWDLEDVEREAQQAYEEARRGYVEDLRPAKPTPPALRTVTDGGQPVRDSLLRLAGKAQDRRAGFVPRDAA